MDITPFLLQLPKVSLHLHLEGAIRPATFVDLAARHRIPLPDYSDPAELYTIKDVATFFQTFAKIRQSVQERDDYRRVTYEVLQDEAAYGVRYCEFFASTAAHLEDGVPFETQMDGMVDGIRDAETDFGIQARIIPCLHRRCTSEQAVEMVERMAARRSDYVIGLGMGGDEEKSTPEMFAKAYQLAGQAGFRRTAHVCERVSPTSEIETCLDVLGCDRLDHGYRIVFDERLAGRCAAQGVLFTTIPLAQHHLMRWYPQLGKEPLINRMVQMGLRVMLDTDDPAIGGVTAVQPYEMAVREMGYQPGDLKTFILNGIDGSWLDESTKRAWRQSWGQEIDAGIARLNEQGS